MDTSYYHSSPSAKPRIMPAMSIWPLYTTAAQRWSLLRILVVGMQENVPLIPLLEQWAQDESGTQQRRIARLTGLLRAGRALPDAVEEVPGILHDEDLLALRFDAQLGTRTAATSQRLAGRSQSDGLPLQRVRRALAYFCTVTLFALLAISFTQLKIIPSIQKIFYEFGLEPSPYMRMPGAILTPLTTFVGLAFMPTVALMIILFATSPGRNLLRAVLGRCFRSVQELRAADVLQKVAVAMNAGRPVGGALSTLARYHYDPTTRRKLLFARNELEQGAEIWHSLAAVKMLTPAEANLLRTATTTENRCWILNQLVSVKRQRVFRRLERFTMFVMPALVLLLAVLVLLQSLSVFDPLVRLIEATL